MTTEEKELLMADLCARAPHGVICQFVWTYSNETTDGEDAIAKENDSIRCIDTQTKEILSDYYGEWVDLEHCKPYLRPRSSMTEEEKKELGRISCEGNIEHRYGIFYRSQDYLNSIHVAYRTIDGKDMFELGLALEAPEGMYK